MVWELRVQHRSMGWGYAGFQAQLTLWCFLVWAYFGRVEYEKCISVLCRLCLEKGSLVRGIEVWVRCALQTNRHRFDWCSYCFQMILMVPVMLWRLGIGFCWSVGEGPLKFRSNLTFRMNEDVLKNWSPQNCILRAYCWCYVMVRLST